MSKTAVERATARAERSRAVAEAYAAELVDPEKEAQRQDVLERLSERVETRDATAALLRWTVFCIAEMVREAHALGVSTTELVRITGVTRQQISNYVAGTTSSRRGTPQ